MEKAMNGKCMDPMQEDLLGSQRLKKPAFFACYLLCSLSSRYKGCTYIGFTVNPRRRIRQHNGEITSGAWQTKRKRPWEMILCIYGFPSQVSALKFEWAWQHPTMSLAVREAVKGLKTLGGTGCKIKLAYTMLTLPEWRSLNLTVNFLSTKHINNTKGCPTLPSHMKVQICPVDELPCYTDYWVLDDDDNLEEGHCSDKSDVSEPEEAGDGDTIPAYYEKSTNIEKKEEKENDLQPAKKCRRRGRPQKQQMSKLAAHESGSEVAFSSTRDLSLEQLNAQVTSVEQDKLNIMFARPGSMLQISDSEDINDNYMGEKQSADFKTVDSPLIPHPSISVNLWEHEDKLSDVLGINCSEDNTHEDNLYDFSIKHKTTTCTDQAEFPSLQEYSPLCYISPLKTAEEVSCLLISPCKSTPTDKLMNLSCSFLSPVVSRCPIITISSTPRRVSRCVIDLTDSPVT